MPSENKEAESDSRFRLPLWMTRPHPSLVGVIGILVTILMALGLYDVERRNKAERFELEVQSIGRAVSKRLDAYEQVLRGGMGLLQASDEVTPKEWYTYVNSLKVDELFPGIQGIGFAKALKKEEVADFVKTRRNVEGLEDYKIWPEHGFELKSGIHFLEPLDLRNKRSIGFDMLSSDTRKEAMIEAAQTGLPAMTGKVDLLQETETDVQAGFLLYLPYFNKGSNLQDIESRERELNGWVYSPFRMNDFLNGILGSSGELISVRVFDGIRKEEGLLLFQSTVQSENAGYRKDLALPLRGNTWLIELTSLPAFEAIENFAYCWIALGCGMLVTLLAMAIVGAYRRTEKMANSIAVDMTQSLAGSEEKIKKLNETLELKVEERTRQLSIANEDLKEFSRTVSHDLRAPLRSIRSFSQIVLEDHSGDLDEDGRGLLVRIDNAGLKLEQTIEDILGLATISNQNPNREEVNLSALAIDILGMLQDGDPKRSVTTVVAEGVVVQGDKVMLERALQNLLQNAWKFSGKKEDARIEFGEETGEKNRHFFVKDNGVGFDSKYKKEIFQPFRRLHRSSDFEGTGLGMAATRKMIQRHGGRIWADSTEGEGAAFFFTLGRQRRKRGQEEESGTDASVPA